MKNKSFITLAVGIVLIAAMGCNNYSADHLKIGVNLPLTGDVSYYGTNAKNGIELAKEQLLASPAFQGKNIELVYEDNQGQGKNAAIVMGKLTSADAVPAVIGGGSSTETMAAAPIAEKTKTVLISPVSSATSVSAAGEYVFRTCPSDLTQAQDLGNWIISQKLNKIAVIYVNSSWGTGFKDNFAAHFKSIGGDIVETISTDPGQSDFRAQVARLKADKVEAYAFIVYAKEGGALVRQAREGQLSAPIFGADPWSQNDFRTVAGDAGNGIRYTTPSQDTGKTFQAFRNAYLKKYNQEPDVYASNGYDCLMLLAKLYQNGARTGEQFQQNLAKTDDFQGATGLTHFDPNGDVIGKKFGRYTISGGKPKLLK